MGINTVRLHICYQIVGTGSGNKGFTCKSQVAMSSDTKARVTVLETIVGVPAEGEQISLCDRLDTVSAETTTVQNDLAEQRELVLNRVEELATVMDAQNQAPRETQHHLETEITLLKRAVSDLPREGEVATKVKVELRDIESGNKVSQRLGSDESVERVFVQEKTYMYMCTDRNGTIVLMDVKTFDQLEVSQELFGKDAKYLQAPPLLSCLQLNVIFCPIVSFDNAKSKDKKVVLENGLTVEVPMFIVVGDAVVINTETDSYVERAKA
nr:elongation factor p [Quercus suber]